jgi:hypothetical protein
MDMNPYEKELQENIENGIQSEMPNEDIIAYRKVFSSLKKEPVAILSPAFADSIIAKVQLQKKKEERRERFLIFAGGFLLILALLFSIVATGFKIRLGFLTQASELKGLLVFGVLFIAFLNFLDKRLVRKNQSVF